MQGKNDQSKDRWDLLPLDVIGEIVKVLTDGAKKYTDNGWKKISPERYFAADMRHKTLRQKGQIRDIESGHYHLAHEACNIIFQLWMQMQKDKRITIPNTYVINEDKKESLIIRVVISEGKTEWFGAKICGKQIDIEGVRFWSTYDKMRDNIMEYVKTKYSGYEYKFV